MYISNLLQAQAIPSFSFVQNTDGTPGCWSVSYIGLSPSLKVRFVFGGVDVGVIAAYSE